MTPEITPEDLGIKLENPYNKSDLTNLTAKRESGEIDDSEYHKRLIVKAYLKPDDYSGSPKERIVKGVFHEEVMRRAVPVIESKPARRSTKVGVLAVLLAS